MSTDKVQRALDDWQSSERRNGKQHRRTLYYLGYYIYIMHNNNIDCISLIAEFMSRLENYEDWKNDDISDALTFVAYVLYLKDDDKAAYPLIRRAVAIVDYLSERNLYDPAFTWSIYVYVLRSLELYKQEIPYDEKLLASLLKKKGESSSEVVFHLMRLDVAYSYCGRYSKAVKCAEKALELHRKYHADDRERTILCLSNLAIDLSCSGRPEEELRIREEALSLTQEVYGADSEKGIEAYERFCKALLKYSSDRMNKPEGLLHKAILRHYQLMQLKISISGCSDPSVLQTKRDLIALYEKNGQITRAVTFQTELVSESRDQNDPPDFFSNRDRYHLIELYWKSGSHKNALLMAQSLLSELTEGLDRETVLQDIKSKEPSIDVKGILMTRVFLQKNQKIASTTIE